MMAHAPGKLVLSGAYVVLDGAPALVAAVDRYAVADTGRACQFVSDELRAAFGPLAPPFVDTSALRDDGRKLGLGSSAAAVLAALWAHAAETRPGDEPTRLRDDLAARAFAAHRAAQGGGSGVDVVACAFGGVRLCERRPDALPGHAPAALPPGLVVEAWACPQSGSTPALLGHVRRFRQGQPDAYAALTADAQRGARLVAAAARAGGDLDACLDGLRAQRDAMRALGAATGAPILTPAVLALGDEAARAEGAVFAQAGAGGGDVALYFGRRPSPEAWRDQAVALGLRPLDLALGAPGADFGPPPGAPALPATSP
jgi:phosphomevalonate kinase